jgi:hypothetical protein
MLAAAAAALVIRETRSSIYRIRNASMEEKNEEARLENGLSGTSPVKRILSILQSKGIGDCREFHFNAIITRTKLALVNWR